MRQHTKSAARLLAATVACGMFSQTATAQFSSTARTSSSSGNSLTSGTTAATGGAGGAGATSGFGTAAGGGGNAANRTAGTGQPTYGQAQSTQRNAQNAFIGGRNQQQFIGGNPLTGQQQNNRQQQQNNRQNNNGQNDNNQNGQTQQNQDPKRAIRPQYRVSFDELPRPTTEIRSTLQPRFDSLSQTPTLRGVAYELDAEGVVVLRGTVDTPSQRRLAENVVKLEPGVKKVRNELTLNEPAATK